METKIRELSVFLPAYNEEDNIRKVVFHTLEVLKEVTNKWELLVIDDGSRDKTANEVLEIAKNEERVRLIRHDINRGYGAAFKTGFYSSKYEWICFTDSDGQFDFAEIVNFIDKQKETNADLVIGYYKKRRVSKFKIVTSKIWELSVFILTGLKVKDIDCGFKLVRKEVIEKIPKLESERGAFISSEFLIKAKKSGFKIVEIPVTHYPRVAGAGTGRNLNVIIKSYIDLFRLWRNLR